MVIILFNMIARNVALVREKIAAAAKGSHRDPAGIRLVCITKQRSSEEMQEVIDCGITDIGENRIQEAKEKYHRLEKAQVAWHLVGHLQTNKAKDAVRMFDLIHSVDSVRLAAEIDRQAAKINKVQDCLIEVNTSGEQSKYGIRPDGLIELVKTMIGLKNINVCGLMTMAPIVKKEEDARPYFTKLRKLQSETNTLLSTMNHEPLTALSMGMTQDYCIAVEEGATMVRVGTAIFEGHGA